MLVKFFLIFVMSAGCALAMLCEQRPHELHEIHTTYHIAEARLEKIKQLETSLRSSDRARLYTTTRNLLQLYSECGITKEEMAGFFGCSEDYITYLLQQDPVYPLITIVHEHFKKGGASLVSPPEQERTVSDRILDSICGVGKSIVSCSPFPNSSSRASTPPATAEEKQALLKKKME